MLTREEANILYRAISSSPVICEPTHVVGLQQFFVMLKNAIQDLTEKDKHEIKTGDIYRSKNGTLREVDEVFGERRMFHVKGLIGPFNFDGIYVGEYMRSPQFDLDLSKNYKLVEVEDASV